MSVSVAIEVTEATVAVTALEADPAQITVAVTALPTVTETVVVQGGTAPTFTIITPEAEAALAEIEAARDAAATSASAASVAATTAASAASAASGSASAASASEAAAAQAQAAAEAARDEALAYVPPPTWTDFASRWDAAPTVAGTTGGGAVYAYTLDGVTRYRLVPAPYDPAQDAFYTTFTGGVLSGLVATRGV